MADKSETFAPAIKLQIPRDALTPLRLHRVLDNWLAGRPSGERLISTYLDTPDLRLFDQQVAIFVRKLGTKRVLTVQRAAKGGNGPQDRWEWKTNFAKQTPDFRGIDDRALRKKLTADKIAGRLRPMFVTDVKRVVWPLKFNNSSVHLVIDIGEIKSRGRRLPICEAGLELKSGEIGDVYALTRELHKSLPFNLESHSTAERGYALASGIAPKANRAAKLEIPRRATIGDAFVLIGGNGLAHLRTIEACVRQRGDCDGIHQIRVTVRRLRSALSMFRDLVSEIDRNKISRLFKWIAKECAEAREWDVFQDELLAPLHKALSGDPLLEEFTVAVGAIRRAADRHASEVLASPQYTECLLRIGAWWEGGGWRKTAKSITDTSLLDFAEARIDRFYRRLCKQGGQIRELDATGLHELRIRAKKLRYATEFFGSLFHAKDVRAYIKALAEIQNCLGALNDGAVAQRLLAQIEARAQGIEPTALARAAGIVTVGNATRLADGLKRLPKTWRRFAAERPFWK